MIEMNYHQSTQRLNDFILWSRSNDVRKKRKATRINWNGIEWQIIQNPDNFFHLVR